MAQRKFKVITRIVQYMWAESRADAIKYQEELIQRGQLTFEKHAETEARFTFRGDNDWIEAPEDFSKTRDPIDQPRPLDWLEIEHDGMAAVALVERISKRKVYYFEALTQSHRSIDKEVWQKWAASNTIHPSYEELLPDFIVEEAVRKHQERNLLSGMNASPDSSLILDILDDYGYRPNQYEVENGFWPENFLETALNDYILEHTAEVRQRGDDEFTISFSENLPTIDDLSGSGH